VTDPQPTAGGAGGLYSHTAAGLTAAEQDVNIPGSPDEEETEADSVSKKETGLA
jgi:hypothetical protein